MKCVLGVDFGTHRLGFAVLEPALGMAKALETYRRKSWPEDVARVRHHAHRWEAQEVVVGLPTLLDGSETEATRRARSFFHALQVECGDLEISWFDETLTSFEADQRMDEDGIPKHRQRAHRDGYAAAALLDHVARTRGYVE